mgnify:CR=1 FL=1|jgi:hypothetical protein
MNAVKHHFWHVSCTRTNVGVTIMVDDCKSKGAMLWRDTAQKRLKK